MIVPFLLATTILNSSPATLDSHISYGMWPPTVRILSSVPEASLLIMYSRHQIDHDLVLDTGTHLELELRFSRRYY
jgi:hypothetical protein